MKHWSVEVDKREKICRASVREKDDTGRCCLFITVEGKKKNSPGEFNIR